LDDIVGYELPVILVGSDHVDLEAFLFFFLRHCAYHIVSLVSADHQHWYMHGTAEFRKGFESVYDQLRRLFPRTFVLRVQFMPEGPSRRVERHGHVGRLLLFDEFQNVFRESEKDRHVRSFGVYHRTFQKCIVHFENKGMPVYQEESFVHS